MNLQENISTFDYSACIGLGVTYTTQSFIINDPDLVTVISPAKFPDDLYEAILAENKQIAVIAPNNFHNIGLAPAKEKLLEAKLYGPKRSAKVSKVDLLKMSEFSSENIEVIKVDGIKKMSESLFLHKPTKSLIITDLAFNMHHKMNLSSTLLFKLVGVYHKLGTSKLVKTIIDDKQKFIDCLTEIMDKDFETVLLSHGDNINKTDFVSHLKALIKDLQ